MLRSSRVRNTLITALAVLAIGCARAEHKPPLAPILASVDGVPITLPQFRERLRLFKLGFENVSGASPSEETKMDLLSQMIQEEMYVREAGRLGVSVSPREVDARLNTVGAGYGPSFHDTLKIKGISLEDYKKEVERDLIVEKLLNMQVYSKVAVTKEQALAYCKENKRKLRKEGRVRVSQIVVGSHGEAGELLFQLRRGTDFAGLAKRRSISPDGAYGGDLGWAKKGDLPPRFESAIRRLKPGEISGIIKTSYGYHIFKVIALEKAGWPTPEEATAEAVKELAKTMGEERFQKWSADLRARTKVDINYALLKDI